MPHGVIATNTAVLREVTRTLTGIWRKALEGPDKAFDLAMKFFMETKSTGAAEDYNWLGSIPAMEEWIDKRPHSSLRQFGQTITNVEYANGIEMPLNWIEDDKLGQMTPRIMELAGAYRTHVWRQFVALLQGGVTADCYDGKKFFALDHVEGASGTQGNTGTAALSAATFEAAYAAMMELKDDRGELMHITPTHMWTTPAQRVTAKEIVWADKIGSGDSNPNKDLVELVLLPGLATSTNWGLVDMSKAMKPFIKQNRRPVAFQAKASADDDLVYEERIARWGSDYRAGYGYGFWQMMYFDVGA